MERERERWRGRGWERVGRETVREGNERVREGERGQVSVRDAQMFVTAQSYQDWLQDPDEPPVKAHNMRFIL